MEHGDGADENERRRREMDAQDLRRRREPDAVDDLDRGVGEHAATSAVAAPAARAVRWAEQRVAQLGMARAAASPAATGRNTWISGRTTACEASNRRALAA